MEWAENYLHSVGIQIDTPEHYYLVLSSYGCKGCQQNTSVFLDSMAQKGFIGLTIILSGIAPRLYYDEIRAEMRTVPVIIDTLDEAAHQSFDHEGTTIIKSVNGKVIAICSYNNQYQNGIDSNIFKNK